MSESPEVRLGELLKARGWTLSVAETTAGGLICARIVGIPGSSAYFDRGVVAYSKGAKVGMLAVDEALIARYGAVSKEMACALAEGVRRIGGTTLGLAETGIAGPVLGRSAKPLGSAFIALSGPEGTVCRSFVFEGGRQEIRHCIVEEALWMGVIYAGGDSERLTS